MQRRTFLKTGVAGTMAGLFPAQGFAQATYEDAVQAARLAGGSQTLVGLIPNGSQDNMRPLVDRWYAETGIAVELEVAPVDQINAIMTSDALLETVRYDFALPATFGVPDLVLNGVLQPLDPLLEESGLGPQGDGYLYQHGDRHEGLCYGHQTDGDVYLMFYRADLMQDADRRLAYEARFGNEIEVPTSWSELDRQIEFFHRPQDGVYGGGLFRIPGYLAWEYLARVYSKGILPWDADFSPQFQHALAHEALEDMRRVSDFLHPAAFSANLFGNWDYNKRDTVYANIGWGGSQKAFNQPGSPIRGKLVHGGLPLSPDGDISYFNWGWSYTVTKMAQAPLLAYLFIRAATSVEGSTLAVREAGGYFDPFHEEHYSDPQIIEAYSRDFLDVHRQAMRTAVSDIYLPGYGNYMAALTRNLSRVFDGSLPVAKALETVSSEWRLITRDLGEAAQKKRWKELIGEAS